MATMSSHCASVYGSVTRGASQMRVTFMWCSNSVSHSSMAPDTGAADDGNRSCYELVQPIEIRIEIAPDDMHEKRGHDPEVCEPLRKR